MSRPAVSIIIPTRNRASMLERTLPLIAAQETIAAEAIYVNDGSTDGTAELLEEWTQNHGPVPMRHIQTGGQGPGPARNRGAAAAQGHYLLFTDDDVEVGPHWAAQMAAGLERSGAGAICGRVEGMPNATPVADYLAHRITNYFGTVPRPVRAAPMMAFAVTRHVFDEINGFREEPLRALEDWEFCHRLWNAGHPIAYDPRIAVRHHYAERYEDAARRMRITGATASYLARDLGHHPIPYLAYATARYATCPLWSFWRYPPRLYPLSLRLETAYYTARLRGFLDLARGRFNLDDWR